MAVVPGCSHLFTVVLRHLCAIVHDHRVPEFALAQPGFGAHVVEELAEIEVLGDRRSRFSGGLAFGLLDVFLSGVVRHRCLLLRVALGAVPSDLASPSD